VRVLPDAVAPGPEQVPAPARRPLRTARPRVAVARVPVRPGPAQVVAPVVRRAVVPGGGLGGPGSGKTRKKKRQDRQTPEEQELRGPLRRDIPLEQQVTKDRVEVVSGITVGELADKLEVAGSALVKKLFEMGEMATVQQTLPDDTIEILCADLGVDRPLPLRGGARVRCRGAR
jgi:translation initiation factor IF-2